MKEIFKIFILFFVIFISCKKESGTAIEETPAPPAPLPEYAGTYPVVVTSRYMNNSVIIKDTTYFDTLSVISTSCVPNTGCVRTFTVIGKSLKEMGLYSMSSQTITFSWPDNAFITYPNTGATLWFKNDSVFMSSQYHNHLESNFGSFSGKRN